MTSQKSYPVIPCRENKKKLGYSIEECPQSINYRKEFNHWECNLVLSHKTKDDIVIESL